MLEATGLGCVRGDRRLFADIGFTLAGGELLHVTGPNGSGKTTLLRMVCGLVGPVAGEIRWGGELAASLGDEYLRQITYVGHQNAIKDELTGRENLQILAALSGVDIDDHKVADALSRMGLKGYDRLPVKVLSQGQKRRTALARLLISKSPLWVLDEPFVALDTDAVDTLQQTIRTYLENGGMVMLTTHQQVDIKGGKIKQLAMGA